MKTRCELCFHHCALDEGQTGLCRARACQDGKIVSLNYGKLTSLALDPIEKKPLRRFHPGSLILSVGSFGCNLRCPFCQNHEISRREHFCPEWAVSSRTGWLGWYNQQLVCVYQSCASNCTGAERSTCRTRAWLSNICSCP